MKNKKLLITTIIIFVLGLMSLTFGILLDSTFKNIDVDERIFTIAGIALIIAAFGITIFSIKKIGRVIATSLVAALIIAINIFMFILMIDVIKEDITSGFKGSELGWAILGIILYFIIFIPFLVLGAVNVVINIVKKNFKMLPNILLFSFIILYIVQFIYFILSCQN